MIDDLKPYPDYKDSGLPWLGAIPSHWDVRRNGRLFAQRNELGFPELPILEVSLKTGVRVRNFENSKRKQVMAEKGKYKRACQSDIAYNMMRMWQGAVGIAPVDGLVSPAYVVARSFPGTLPQYFIYLFRTAEYMGEVNAVSRGIVSDRNRLYWQDFKQIASPFPPPDEQTAIVRFLDHANGRVERAIRAKRKLIALLNEQKQAIIHRAVTRGLDPAVKLKPSGIPWLGDVPEHWEVMALRFRYDQCLGKMLDAKKITGNYLVPYLRNTDVQWDKINVNNLPQIDIKPHEIHRYTLQSGDLLICEGGEVGRSAIWGAQLSTCAFQKAIHRLRPLNNNVDIPRFLFYLMFLGSKLGIFLADGSVSTIAHLTGDKLRSHRFIFPPRNEQQAITSFLQQELSVLNNAISQAEQQIALLREYRTTLTAEVVTGKLDVRGAAKHLPHEVEEPILPDDFSETEELDESLEGAADDSE